MARLYLRKTLRGFEPADEEGAERWRNYKLGEVYRADVVKPRSYQHHKLCMALLTLTFQNQEQYTNFDDFRKAVALAAGHSSEFVAIDGEIMRIPGSISYDALDEVEFTDVFKRMMAVCCSVLKSVSMDELEAEVSRYAGEHYGAFA